MRPLSTKVAPFGSGLPEGSEKVPGTPPLVGVAADRALAGQGSARLDRHDAAAQFAVDLQQAPLHVDDAAEEAGTVARQEQGGGADLDEGARAAELAAEGRRVPIAFGEG